MDAADARIAVELERRLGVIESVERDDPARRALTAADLWLFVGVVGVITLLGILVLAL